MKRLVFTIAVTVFGFLLGLGAFVVWRSFQTLPYCEVARHGAWYHNTIVRVRATLIFGSDGMYVFEQCDPVDALASMVELEGTSAAGGRNYVEEVLVTGDKAGVMKVDAIIEGRFNAKFTMGCWRPKYHIAARRIELISAVTDYKLDPLDETKPRTAH